MPTWLVNMVHKMYTMRNGAEVENTIPAPLPGIQLTGAFTWLILNTLHPKLAKERLPVYVDQYNLPIMLKYYLLVLFLIS